ncbi:MULTISPECIES: hypothetical protein [Streptomyces]|uniref:ApeA N-terminal domain-containing protein n=1 Tax=Streptomyces californicus TaxID=67351 RepID=A0ABX7JCU9_9ACTN|nr:MULTISPECIES: hypothetical protein [Streptomyces]QRV45978.1 hypothetical protein I6J41_35010 [Streptomyces californicus]
MISRYQLKCHGCGETFVARLGVEPTRSTRFYLPCPHCALPIRGSMSGTELDTHRIDIECEVLSGSVEESPDARVVTVNPFVPSRYDADSFTPLGSFPTMTLVQALGDDAFKDFHSERNAALRVGQELWPKVRMLFQYYLQGNTAMFDRIAQQNGLTWQPSTSHERTSIAYQCLGQATTVMTGTTGTTSAKVMGRFLRKHSAASERNREYILTIRRRGQSLGNLERDVFTELNGFAENHESWEMGLLGRFFETDSKSAFEELVLFRDEFSLVRSLYQQGFELACKCLWPLVAAQNSLKRGNPDDFGDVHPDRIPVKQRPTSLDKFDKISAAYKIAYVAQVPGWESFESLLNSSRRNTIAHGTAHHDLQTGRIISDESPSGLTYLEFLGEVLGVFEALSTLSQVIRSSRVASSPDFNL